MIYCSDVARRWTGHCMDDALKIFPLAERPASVVPVLLTSTASRWLYAFAGNNVSFWRQEPI